MSNDQEYNLQSKIIPMPLGVMVENPFMLKSTKHDIISYNH